MRRKKIITDVEIGDEKIDLSTSEIQKIKIDGPVRVMINGDLNNYKWIVFYIDKSLPIKGDILKLERSGDYYKLFIKEDKSIGYYLHKDDILLTEFEIL